MKIAGFFQHLPPYPGAGSLRALSTFKALSERLSDRASIEAFTTTRNAQPIEGVRIEAIDVDEVENTEKLHQRLWGELKLGLVASKRIVFRRNAKFDLVIISSPAYVAALLIAFFARVFGLPYVLEIRDIYPEVYRDAGLLRDNSFVFAILSRMSRAMYSGARHIVTATNGLGDKIAFQARHDRVTTIYNGFPSTFLAIDSTKETEFAVCFHGVMGYFQDIETLIEVARRLSVANIKMVVIGYGRKQTLLEGAMPSNVHFLGRLGFDETIAAIARCQLGLCLRTDNDISQDSFPVKVWEYIGLGIPTIITPPSEAGRFVEENGCGHQMQAGDAQSIADAILQLRADAESMDKMRENCRSVAPRHTREIAGAKIAAIVERVANWDYERGDR